MASKVWKKLLFIILIIACLFNITIKLVQRKSFKSELQSSAQYVQDIMQNETLSENATNNNLSTVENNFIDENESNTKDNTIIINLN